MTPGAPSEAWLEAANLHATVAQLLSTVIHQVNNALQTIGGHAELLKTDVGATDTTKRRAQTITSVTNRTADLLATFQIFTHPPEGPVLQNLRDVAARALAFRHYGLGRARIEAVVQGADDAFVLAEPRPLMQAVLNVVVNAEQALAGASGGRIALDVSREAGQVVLAIEDNGPGSSPVLPGQLKMVGPLNRLGLGLDTASRIVSRLGGRLNMGPGASGGTRVTIALPAASPQPGR